MLLAQEFRTYEGACKRAVFEKQHQRNPGQYRFHVHRTLDGKIDLQPLDAERYRRKKYRWRIEKLLVPNGDRASQLVERSRERARSGP